MDEPLSPAGTAPISATPQPMGRPSPAILPVLRRRRVIGLVKLIAIYTLARLLIVACIAAALLGIQRTFDLRVSIVLIALGALGLGSAVAAVALRAMRGRLQGEITAWDAQRRFGAGR